jgi:hypothetical protein
MKYKVGDIIYCKVKTYCSSGIVPSNDMGEIYSIDKNNEEYEIGWSKEWGFFDIDMIDLHTNKATKAQIVLYGDKGYNEI